MGYKNAPVEHQFKKGYDPKRGGKPKGAISVTKRLKQLLAEELPDGTTLLDKFTKSGLDRAIKKSDKLWEAIVDRTDGKVTQAQDITLRIPKPILDLNAILNDDSDKESSETKEKN